MCIWRKPPSFLQTLRGSAAFRAVQVISQTLLCTFSSLSRSAWTLLENAALSSPDRTSAFGGLNLRNWILTWEKQLWTWKSSSELTQPYPSRETCSGAARNASLARQAERKPKSLFCKSTRSVAWGSLSYNPPKNLAPIAS